MSGCPHKGRVHLCPLYIAAHMGSLCSFGCGDNIEPDRCGADQRGDYAERLARLREEWPGFVAGCEDDIAADDARAQRRRNMRALGLH